MKVSLKKWVASGSPWVWLNAGAVAISVVLVLGLLGVFAVLLILPLGIVTFAFAWAQLPDRVRDLVPDGWHVVILIPLVVLLGWMSFS
ncbi:MAG TPA: hypothetical protein VJY57_05465, partial [Thiopseudomonas sp.]|nr:hypothetical protein [Thiopseudomonas sp.]